MDDASRRAAMRTIAAGLDRIDRPVYEAAGRDPLDPIVGSGDPTSPVCMFGRDPGRTEVELGKPFVGVGGQKVRAALHRAFEGTEPPDRDAAIAVGERVFWANTVPYKPVGNKVWPEATRKAFRPLLTDLLLHHWQGSKVLALGRVAFFWFAHTKDDRARLKAHWAREDRYEVGLELVLRSTDGAARALELFPMPHPSPLNATWAPHVPRLLDTRLRALGVGRSAR